MTQHLPIVEPTVSVLAQIAGHRFDSAVGNDHDPGLSRAKFIGEFTGWIDAHRETHLCRAVLDGDDVIGFGFVALTARVPAPHRRTRYSGDVQAVYVLPSYRSAGIGGRLITALVDLAHEHGVEHITVHSSDEAITAYQRAGFVSDPTVLFQTAP